MAYEIAKWLHILSSTVLFGTGLGSAYYMFFASRAGARERAAARGVHAPPALVDRARRAGILLARDRVLPDGRQADVRPGDSSRRDSLDALGQTPIRRRRGARRK